jgi:hypothetical protein
VDISWVTGEAKDEGVGAKRCGRQVWERERSTYQIQAAAPSNSCATASSLRKSCTMTTLSLEEEMLEGRGLRVRAMMAVMPGLAMHWCRTSVPMKPDVPVRMIFMLLVGFW